MIIHDLPFLSAILACCTLVLPWRIRRLALSWLFGYKIHPTARIGLSIVVPRALEMGPNSRIGSLNYIRRQDLVLLKEGALIGHLNSIGGYGRTTSGSFRMQSRSPSLILHAHAAITSRHLFDCTDCIEIGEYSLIAGYRSQFLTHSPRLSVPAQTCSPIFIGKRVFVGTGAIFLRGASTPDCVVVSAGSLVKGPLSTAYALYEGVPAQSVRTLPADYGFFTRADGPID